MLCKRTTKKKNPASKEASQKSLSHADFLRVQRCIFPIRDKLQKLRHLCGQLWNQDVAQVSLLVVQTDVGGLKCRKTSSNLLEPAVFVELHEAIQ